MQEVTVRIRFTTPCLGNQQRKSATGKMIYSMPKDHAGRVMFFTTWWQTSLLFAAKVNSNSDKFIRDIRWSVHVDGAVSNWKRYLTDNRTRKRNHKPYAMHEAFRPGTIVGITAVLPTGFDIEVFKSLLVITGAYKGISPFRRGDEAYGLFEVESVLPAKRSMNHNEET
jgi:hypothetical protein